MKKIRVAVLYGGRSGEHEVALRSAASVINHLDRNRFEIVPIGIDKDGKWHLAEPKVLEQKTVTLPVFKDQAEVLLPSNPGAATSGLLPVRSGEKSSGTPGVGSFDVVFPVLHGTNGEDGTVQGLLELAEVAYVGCGVLSSAVGMDKEVAKRLILAAGIPVVPWISLRARDWSRSRATIATEVEKKLGYPCFVKPANSGSSVGVHKVKSKEQISSAIEDAFRFDDKVLIEKAIDAREIELSVLENLEWGQDPKVSVAGEVNATHEFYSYEAKYLDENGAEFRIPAQISSQELKTAQDIARRAFQTLECEGLARVDLFLDRQSGQFYFNEVNTLPGFTSISMYPKMWEASGLSYSDLLTQLVQLAVARRQRKSKLVRDFNEALGSSSESNSLSEDENQ